MVHLALPTDKLVDEVFVRDKYVLLSAWFIGVLVQRAHTVGWGGLKRMR